MPRALPLLLCATLLAPSCLSPEPGVNPPPDTELRATLRALKDVRGGEFEVTEAASNSGTSEDELVRELQSLAFRYPRHVPTLVANAAVSYERGDPVNAQKYLDQALDVDPGHVHASLLRVRIAAEEGSLQYASRWLRSQLELAPDNTAVREAYAGVLYLQSEYKDAEQELDNVERLLGPEHEDAWRLAYHRGLIAEARGDLGRAEELYGRCSELNPEFERGMRRWRWMQSSSSR